MQPVPWQRLNINTANIGSPQASFNAALYASSTESVVRRSNRQSTRDLEISKSEVKLGDLEKFFQFFEYQGLLFNNRGGLFESYLFKRSRLQLNLRLSETVRNDRIIVHSRPIGAIAEQELLSHLQKVHELDKKQVHPMLNVFYRDKNIYVTSPFIGQGRNDLFRFANFKQQFSEKTIG